MKPARLVKTLLSLFSTRKKLVIVSGATLGLVLAGVTTYAHYRYQEATPASTISPQPSTPAKTEATPTQTTPQTSVGADSPTPTPASTNATSQQSTATPPAATQQSTAERRASLPMPAPPVFSLGHLTGSVACYTGVYAYGISNIAISLANDTKAFPGFYWQVELSNGTILENGGAHIPSGSTVLPSFPSTPSMPSSFKLIYNPPDGLSARFVITSPTYAASNWTSPVPAGSGTSCHASPDYIPQ